MNAVSSAADDHGELITAWFEAFHAPLFRYLLRLVGDEHQAADLLQDTFLQALTTLAKQAPPVFPFAWLHRIATNKAYNALRRQKRWRWLAFNGHEATAHFEPAVATAHSLRRCLLRLRPHEAEVLLLYEWVGLTCAEIAALTDEQPSAIRMRLCRARTHFCDDYEHEVGNDL